MEAWYNNATVNFRTFREQDEAAVEKSRPITIEDQLAALPADRVEKIRKAYVAVYDAMHDAVPALMRELEMADLDSGSAGGPLLREHLLVCELLERFGDSGLKEVL